MPPDRVNRVFHAPAPNRLWLSDFTDVSTWSGFVYVAPRHDHSDQWRSHSSIIGAYARRIVGWRVSRTAHARFVLDALEQALHARRPVRQGGLVHQSSREPRTPDTPVAFPGIACCSWALCPMILMTLSSTSMRLTTERISALRNGTAPLTMFSRIIRTKRSITSGGMTLRSGVRHDPIEGRPGTVLGCNVGMRCAHAAISSISAMPSSTMR